MSMHSWISEIPFSSEWSTHTNIYIWWWWWWCPPMTTHPLAKSHLEQKSRYNKIASILWNPLQNQCRWWGEGICVCPVNGRRRGVWTPTLLIESYLSLFISSKRKKMTQESRSAERFQLSKACKVVWLYIHLILNQLIKFCGHRILFDHLDHRQEHLSIFTKFGYFFHSKWGISWLIWQWVD